MKIQIKNLTFNCIIGILDFERIEEQEVIINCSLEYTYTKENFINYAEVANTIESIMKLKKFELLEEAIIFIELQLNKQYTITNLRLEIAKPNIIDNCQVSLSNI